MFKLGKHKKDTFKVDLPKVYLDGLVKGKIQGWAQAADSVILYLSDKKIAEVSCNNYREDLVDVLTDANSSFSYALTESEIHDDWLTRPTITIKAEFIVNGHIDDIAEEIISTDNLITQLNLEQKDSAIIYCLDGIVNDKLSGWCANSDKVDLFIEHEHIVTLSTCEPRLDLQGLFANIECGFSYAFDAKHLKSHWFKKEVLSVKAVFRSHLHSDPIGEDHCQIDCLEFLNSIHTLNDVAISYVADVINMSMLWDEGYYNSQLEQNEINHVDRIYDFILKCTITGRNPNTYFNTYYYLANNPDVADNGINPFFHYLIAGEKEGRRPGPFFNPELYRTLNPDLINWDGPLLSHLIQAGLKEGRIYNEFPVPSNHQIGEDPYQTWRLNHDQEQFNEIVNDLAKFAHNPMISIVVPVYNTDKELLEACIDSVRAQSYTNWQLCLADDCSPESHVRELLQHYQELDPRIQVVFREKNGHISAASNSALEMAKGEWTALLDHDDELHQHSLYYVVKAINQQPNVELLYSDEDKIDEHGVRKDPHFKSDWNLDLLYSQNYVSHLGIYKTAIIKKIGGFRLGYEGSQDYDLLLRYSREIDYANIVHIPKVLYHWRAIVGSTAMGAGEKSYTTDAGIKALEDHFKALKQDVTVEKGKHDNIYKVNWPINSNPFISLIIPTYNGHVITKQAIDSILDKSTYRNFEIILVDNNSNDPESLAYFDEIAQHEQVTLLRYPYPFNYSAINNFAAQYARGEVLGLINNDIEVITPGWLEEMASHAIRPDIGCVGAMLYYPNDTVQHAGVVIGIGGVAGHSHKHFRRNDYGYFSRLKTIQNYSAVTAACLLVRRDVFDEVNGLNEENLTIAFNDIDFCLKVQQAGYRNLWTPYAELYHHESISRGAEDNPEKIKRFNSEVDYMIDTWNTNERPDSYYNCNLTLVKEDFSIGI